MLEPKMLKKTPVPDPTQISPMIKRRLLTLVDKRISLSVSPAPDVEKQIDELVADLYGLSNKERQAVGMRD